MKIFSKLTVVLVLLVGLSSNEAYSQQDPQYSMYMFNPLSSNPAYAGSRDALSVTLLGRKQWVGIDGAPETGSLTLHSPLKNENIAVGLSINYDKIGPSTNNMIYADVAYRFQVSPTSKLSFGLKGGIDMYSANFSGLIVNDASDILYTTPVSNQIMPNFGFGVYWYSPESYVGLTAPRLMENDLRGASLVSGEPAKQNRHYFLMAGHTFKLTSTIDLVPSTVVKAVQDAPLSIDFNVNFFFYEKLWIGGGYRLGDAIVANIVYHFTPKFRAGYAYDYTVSDLGTYNTGSHEIMLNYDLDFLGKGFKTPRRF
jgi:type IX secretion system PorP/SprF family membrane protein